MENTKTIREWLETLPTDHPNYGNIREKALSNLERLKDPYFLREEGFENALEYSTQMVLISLGWVYGSFSIEGNSYWKKIIDELNEGTLFNYQKQETSDVCGAVIEDNFTPTAEEIETVRRIIEKQKISPWIRVADGLPDYGEFVLIAENGDIIEAELQIEPVGIDYWQDRRGGVRYPTHWLPKTFIPEPPKV